MRSHKFLFFYPLVFFTVGTALAAPDWTHLHDSDLESDFLSRTPLTSISLDHATALFNEAVLNSHIRMPSANNARGGLCYPRYVAFKSWLKTRGVTSGLLELNCGGADISLIDQFTQKPARFWGYHHANIIAVQDRSHPQIYVLDGQFMNQPVALAEYLTLAVPHHALHAYSLARDLRLPSPGDSQSDCVWYLAFGEKVFSYDLE